MKGRDNTLYTRLNLHDRKKKSLWPSFYTHYATICIYTYIYNMYVYMYVYIHTYICREILGEAESNRLHPPYIMI